MSAGPSSGSHQVSGSPRDGYPPDDPPGRDGAPPDMPLPALPVRPAGIGPNMTLVAATLPSLSFVPTAATPSPTFRAVELERPAKVRKVVVAE